MKARTALGAALGAGALAMVGALACNDPTYSFLGRRYVPDRDCLQSTVSVDVMRGKDPGNCPARCLVAKARNDAGEPIEVRFVTVMCAPYPPEAPPSDDPLCKDALEAFERRANCLADGGSSSPIEDASMDAPVDAPPTEVDATIDPPDAALDASTLDAALDALAD